MNYSILVIGSGGTGTYFLKEFTRYIATAGWDVQRKIVRMVIADGDKVEEKNLSRQCFCKDDIGRNKAATYAEALNDMMGDISDMQCSLSWESYTSYITEPDQLDNLLCNKGGYESWNHIPVIIGAVDNDACRMLCEQWFTLHENCYYFDSGNDFSSGECIYSYKKAGKVLSPLKSHYFPVMKEQKNIPVTELSCEELNNAAPQHILTNMLAAIQLLGGIMMLLDPKKKETDNKRLGYSFFDAFDCINEFYQYNMKREEGIINE